MTKLEVLTSTQTREVELGTIKEKNITVADLMLQAGKAVAEEIDRSFTMGKCMVFCGPGNNGGDGYVIAAYLHKEGWDVTVVTVGDHSVLPESAAYYRQQWTGQTLEVGAADFSNVAIIVDAIFGIGLDRPVIDDFAEAVKIINDSRAIIVAVDIASGINSDSGEIMEFAVKADLTVTFNYLKMGHLLLPGRINSGEVRIVDIGLLPIDSLNVCVNNPQLWQKSIPVPKLTDNKYNRGSVLILASQNMPGATSLASLAARKMGAGLVTLACTEKLFPIYANAGLGHIIKIIDDFKDWKELVNNHTIKAVLIGPGNEADKFTRQCTNYAISQGKKCIIDAGAIKAYEKESDIEDLINLTRENANCIFTPHQGEFHRLFHSAGGKMRQTLQAARVTNSVILFKGADTVIAAPNAQALLQNNAPAWLATAGSGDVLSGIILGLLAQNVDCFHAAAMGSWIHAETANLLGRNLIAEELPSKIPEVMQELSKIIDLS